MRVRLMMAFALLVTCTTATGNTGDSPLKDKTTPVGKAMKKNILKQELWPDGTEIPAWFRDTTRVDLTGLRRYVVTDYGVDRYGDGVQTKALQAVIDRCAAEGGGVVVIPRGTFLSGSLFFKPKTHLLIEEGGELKGSDRIRDFQIVKNQSNWISHYKADDSCDKCNLNRQSK